MQGWRYAAPSIGSAVAPEGLPGSAGIVHDLGNLIQIAASAVNIIGRNSRTWRDPSLEPALARARTALERASDLVRQTASAIRVPDVQMRATTELQHLPSCLAEIDGLIRWVCDPDITLSIDAPDDLPPICCNRIELQSAVLNLAINARDAMPEGGALAIRAREATGGAALELSITDNGQGMSPSVLAQAFRPYFTTKPEGRGSGLGLAMVKRFAQEANGEVEITSAPGRGARVTLRLPTARFGSSAHDASNTRR
ncbi:MULTISPECIES: sensor histidine kinase [Phenylobacterium]|uniref:histidine kinase n=1 Tax=Phenylobacterium koreense TaxID=266125 RepID=A0ABV2EEU6_9CAUL